MHTAAAVPRAWRDVPCITVDTGQFADRAALTATIDRLRSLRLDREPHVVVLDPSVVREGRLDPTVDRRPLWVLGPRHRLLADELAFLLADLIDLRSGTPVWWPAVRASRLGCSTPPVGSTADVLLPDGRPARIEGGPRGPSRRTSLPNGAGPAGAPEDDDTVVRVHRESVELVGTLDEERDATPTEGLSDEQHAAVTHPSGPARVLAPAGSGKTRVLAARLRHLVHGRGVQPPLVTALAYNTRAAEELTERTRDVIVGGVRPRIRTVHALGLAICTAALGRRPEVLDRSGVAAALRSASDGRAGSTGGPPVDALIAALTDVRLGLRDPREVEASRGDVPGFARIVPRYRALLHAQGALDFDEQVHLATALLLADPRLRARVTRSTTHLLVDEAQDLTPAFVLLVRVLTGGGQQLFAVGDDDQTIYGYAGATPRVLVDLPDAYAGATSYTLSVNHRCPPAVVRAASDLLAHNTVRVAKTIRTPVTRERQDAGDLPALAVLEAGGGQTPGAGTTAIVTAIRRHLVGRAAADLIVLGRVGSALLATQVALDATGLPIHRHVGPEVLHRSGLRTALAYLRIAGDPDRIDPSDLSDTLQRPARRLHGVLAVPAGTTGLRQIARDVLTADPEHRAALRRYVDDLALLAGMVRDGADSTRLVAAIRGPIGLGASLDALDRRRVRPEGSSHGDDLEALAEFAGLEPDPRLLPTWLARRLHPPAVRPDDAITLSTVHRVKGREWDVVVLVGLRAGLIPHRLCDDLEEERRVLHVALTRARQHLLLVTDPQRPSPFLPELLGTLRPSASAAPDEQALLRTLRAWRRDRAATDGVPAFLIAHDRTLADIARRRPKDRAALRACHGIGPARLARYGDQFLALLGHPPVPTG